jgi:hypothetical protein
MGNIQTKINQKEYVGNDTVANFAGDVKTINKIARDKFLSGDIKHTGYIFNLDTTVVLLFNEDEHEIEDQLVLFPHETTSKLDKFTEHYEQLKKDRKEMDQLLKKQQEAIKKAQKRAANTKNQIGTVVKKNVTEDMENTKKVKQIHENLEELSKKFGSLISDYRPKGNLGIEELKDLWKQDQVNAAKHIKTVANTASKQTPTEVKIEVKSAGGAKKIEFKEDPLDYIFENKDLKEIAKLWNIQYSKNILPTLKIAFKYKNRSVLNNKEWKQLVSKLNIKFKTNDLNKPEIVELVKKKLINVPTI